MKIVDIKAAQDLALCIGRKGCYLLCLFAVAEEITGKDIDALKAAKYLIDNKLVDYNYERPGAYPNAMYVFDADKILAYLGCRKCYIDKVKELPKGYDGHYIIRYTYEGTTHFILPDYDPMTDNPVVKKGRVTAYYLVRQRESA